MDILQTVLVILHLLCWALAFGYAVSGIKSEAMPKGVLHGVLGALLTGLLLVGVAEMRDVDVNHMKIGIKLFVALIATGMAIWGGRQEKASKGFIGGIAALVAVNVIIAVAV